MHKIGQTPYRVDCMFLSCQVCVSDWIHTLKLPECQGVPSSKQTKNLKFKWLQLDLTQFGQMGECLFMNEVVLGSSPVAFPKEWLKSKHSLFFKEICRLVTFEIVLRNRHSIFQALVMLNYRDQRQRKEKRYIETHNNYYVPAMT